jgi:hypothetical protein
MNRRIEVLSLEFNNRMIIQDVLLGPAGFSRPDAPARARALRAVLALKIYDECIFDS